MVSNSGVPWKSRTLTKYKLFSPGHCAAYLMSLSSYITNETQHNDVHIKTAKQIAIIRFKNFYKRLHNHSNTLTNNISSTTLSDNSCQRLKSPWCKDFLLWQPNKKKKKLYNTLYIIKYMLIKVLYSKSITPIDLLTDIMAHRH